MRRPLTPPRLEFALGVALGTLLLACGEAPSTKADQEGQVILTVVLDALHAGHVHHLGYERETTPNIDALATEGVTFTRAAAPAPYTVASTASLMTGLLPQRHGILQRFGPHIRPAASTIAQYLSLAGWQCFGATANGNAGEVTGITGGFHEWIEAYRGPGGEGERTYELSDGSALHFVSPLWWPGHLEGILERRDPARNTFIYLHVLQPHAPYMPPAEYLERFADPNYVSSWSEEGLPEGFAAGETGPLMRSNDGEMPLSAADRQHTVDLYDATLVWADEAVGELIEVLRSAGVWDSTWIIVTSDHGEAFWQHGRWGHNRQLYEEMLRVPLVVRGPAGLWPRGGHSNRLVSPMDLLPSILEWAGLPPVEGLDGQALSRALEAEGPDDRRLLLMSNGDTPLTGLTQGCIKLIVGSDEGDVPRLEQYHLPSDPAERENVLGGPPRPAAKGAVADRRSESFGDDCPEGSHGIDEAHSRALWKVREALVLLNEAERARSDALDELRPPFNFLLPRKQRPPAPQDGTPLLDALGYGGDQD